MRTFAEDFGRCQSIRVLEAQIFILRGQANAYTSRFWYWFISFLATLLWNTQVNADESVDRARRRTGGPVYFKENVSEKGKCKSV